MNRKELLHEQYEDALFALLMDAVADSEGAKALEENSRLQAEPHFQMPDSVDSRSLQTIHRHFAKLKRRSVQKYTARALGKAMIAVGVASTLFFTAFASSETVRANTLNLISETFVEKTRFHFSGNQDSVVPQISAGWLPDGYSLSNKESNVLSSWAIYENSKNSSIYVMYSYGEGSVVSMDTQNAKINYKEINGTPATFIYKADEIQIIWEGKIDDKTVFLRILGSGVDEADLIHVASEITY